LYDHAHNHEPPGQVCQLWRPTIGHRFFFIISDHLHQIVVCKQVIS